MTKRNQKKLNLERSLPEGMLVDAAWLTRHGYSTALRSQYLASGWLEQPANRVYRRPRGQLKWQQVILSLQSILSCPVAVGGRTSLELQGFAHYLKQTQREVHLYGPKRPPTWLNTLPLATRFAYHNDRKLFRHSLVSEEFGNPDETWNDTPRGSAPATAGLTTQPWGDMDWQLVLSTPERAVLELLDELPDRESFDQVDQLMEGLTNLSPSRLELLFKDCGNVKVKRLFFYFADRHKHAWLKYLDTKNFDLGKGKRSLVKGGKLDSRYQITVPKEMNADH